MEVIDSVWFTSGAHCIGIVRIKTEFGETKYYIGVGAGHDQEADEQHIAHFGARFPDGCGASLLGK